MTWKRVLERKDLIRYEDSKTGDEITVVSDYPYGRVWSVLWDRESMTNFGKLDTIGEKKFESKRDAVNFARKVINAKTRIEVGVKQGYIPSIKDIKLVKV